MPDLQKGKSVSRLENRWGRGGKRKVQRAKKCKNEKKHTKNAEHELQHSHLKSIRTPTPRSGSSLPGRGELHRCAPSAKWILTSWAGGANLLHRPIAGQGSCRQTKTVRLNFYPIKKQHFIQGQQYTPKKGKSKGGGGGSHQEQPFARERLPPPTRKYVGSNLQLACRGPERPAEGREQASFLPMPGPGLDIKIKKASSDRER